MTQEIKIEKKASEVIQPESSDGARQAIRAKKDLSGANLRGMPLSNLHAVSPILRKTDLAEADLSHGLFVNPNFYRASLHGAAVHNTVFLGADMVKTSFKEADLTDSAFVGVDAQNASFEKAILRNAGLVSANFKDADFTQADLTNARLAAIDVEGTDFTDATLTGARAYNVDWSKAKVPPAFIPEPFLQLPQWVWSVLIGGLLGIITLIIYSLVQKRKRNLN
jgi:uncharacterized protein YjbI with pentapeptide repeats